jgi:hypothetical protein
MKKLRENIKDWITDIIGLVIWIVAIVLFYLGRVILWPDFIILMIIGGVFFLLPDKLLTDMLQKFIGKKLDKE